MVVPDARDKQHNRLHSLVRKPILTPLFESLLLRILLRCVCFSPLISSMEKSPSRGDIREVAPDLVFREECELCTLEAGASLHSSA
eukprot:CAMPEP_0169393984 /NCGR_PEP_ID=MMETSP1017-20121227/49728_1 /TAXON_ID=342587 /ORGANISM="Karlodinium micrum, Strain CCMP2283" /LENGTH=85 /DNA_ID=CAMNT_0009497597 /DNA_START=344 /DNA_END=601 /DNA_ORIENTATION=+